MSKLEGKISITRPRGPEGDFIKIEIEDNNSHATFVSLTMTLEEFGLAITGLCARPVELDVRGLGVVGKIREQKGLVFSRKLTTGL